MSDASLGLLQSFESSGVLATSFSVGVWQVLLLFSGSVVFESTDLESSSSLYSIGKNISGLPYFTSSFGSSGGLQISKVLVSDAPSLVAVADSGTVVLPLSSSL